jgi:hypothetical protein
MRVFPVWPTEVDARFTNLRIQGAFLVSSELKNGGVAYINIISEKGKLILLENPWPGQTVRIQRKGKNNIELKGQRLPIETMTGEVLNIRPVKSRAHD